MQLRLFEDKGLPVPDSTRRVQPFRLQLLKWLGNKQRFAHEIAAYFPSDYGAYIEPFLGSGAVLGTLAPERAVASDALRPLAEMWIALHANPELLVAWYAERWQRFTDGDRERVYEEVRQSYNQSPNAADLLFLSRACYGGVVRFRRDDGSMSTPCGPHNPISPQSFEKRVRIWHDRTKGTTFLHSDFGPVMERAGSGDIVYCDPPYRDTQRILYGAQSFSLPRLLRTIARCKERGVRVALSIDGSKKSGRHLCGLHIPDGLFETEVAVNCGKSMLRRFQMKGKTLGGELVTDRLLLTW